jgi:tetratricopeptide (TPR) repeat protein
VRKVQSVPFIHGRLRRLHRLLTLGVVLGALGRVDEGLAAYQRVIDDYADDPDPTTRQHVAEALGNLGVLLGKLGRADQELAAYQRVIDDYADDPVPTTREAVDRANSSLKNPPQPSE